MESFPVQDYNLYNYIISERDVKDSTAKNGSVGIPPQKEKTPRSTARLQDNPQ